MTDDPEDTGSMGYMPKTQKSRKLDDTVIIYTSDNGFLFGQYGRLGKSVPYEEAIKVRLVIRGPGIPENQTRGQLVNNLDVVATIVELAGATSTR
jgi:N-acetylglucosamine-6-sulfatase